LKAFSIMGSSPSYASSSLYSTQPSISVPLNHWEAVGLPSQFSDYAQQITETIWLGSEDAAYVSLDQLKDHKIFHILVIGTELMQKYRDDLHYLQIRVKEDGLNICDLLTHFQTCNNFIKEVKDKQECVLIHCAMGYSRSPTVVAAWLMESETLTVNEAIEKIQTKRHVHPNPDFRRQLEEFEEVLHSSKSDSSTSPSKDSSSFMTKKISSSESSDSDDFITKKISSSASSDSDDFITKTISSRVSSSQKISPSDSSDSDSFMNNIFESSSLRRDSSSSRHSPIILPHDNDSDGENDSEMKDKY